jgi:tRNA threonylcarbamoyladenosine biosynthesis protein TsaE
MKIVTESAHDTEACGRTLGGLCVPGDIICLFGDLGTGKTTLIKGIASALAGIATEEVCSPTFSYLHIYPGRCPVYHFDLYRLRGIEDFLSMGFEDYFFMGGVCCIEWSERITPLLPFTSLHVTLHYLGEERREITYEATKR